MYLTLARHPYVRILRLAADGDIYSCTSCCMAQLALPLMRHVIFGPPKLTVDTRSGGTPIRILPQSVRFHATSLPTEVHMSCHTSRHLAKYMSGYSSNRPSNIASDFRFYSTLGGLIYRQLVIHLAICRYVRLTQLKEGCAQE